uniref:UVR domain-containing protein n=1 Tax=Spongospora subterranea TaxID=70186 RepID=A0A0H5R790_9EUKA|eukprot:CRZ09978.1 hypothetical protein [Spongospora subterranea]
MASFFKNVFSAAKPTSPSESTPKEHAPQPFAENSMFAGLAIKASNPSLPADHSRDHDDSHEITSAIAPVPEPSIDEDAVPPSVFSFLQPSSSSFDFISDDHQNRSISMESAPEPRDFFSNLPLGSSQLPPDIPPHSTRSVSQPLPDTTPVREAPISPTSPSLPTDVFDSDPPESIPDPLNVKSNVNKLCREFCIVRARQLQDLRSIEEDDLRHYHERIESLIKLSIMNGDLEAVKTSQANAVEEEAYDRADELDCKIRALAQQISELENHVQQVTQLRLDITGGRRRKTEEITSSGEDFIHQLQGLKQACLDEGNSYVQNGVLDMGKKEVHLKQELSRVDRILEMVSADLGRVQAEEDEIHGAILERTEASQIMKQESITQLKDIDDEIISLKEQVRQKEAVRKDIQEKLTDAERQISQASSSFQRQLARIESQRARIKQEQAEIVKDRSDLDEAQHTLDQEKLVLAQKEAHSAKLSAEIAKIIDIREKQIEFVLRDAKDQEVYALKKSELDKAVEMAQVQLAEHDRRSQLLSSQMATLAQNITSSETNVASILVELPQLEQSKSDAVIARDFKAASRMSKQIKELTSSKQELLADLDKMRKSCDAVQESIDQQEVQLEDSRQKFRITELEVDRCESDHLQRKIASVIICIDDVEDEELNVLTNQLDELRNRSEYLSTKHGPLLTPGSPPLSTRSVLSAGDSDTPSSSSPSSARHAASALEERADNGDCSSAGIQDPALLQQQLSMIDDSIKSLEEKLHMAVVSDDFDEADAIQTRLNELEIQKRQLQILENTKTCDRGSANEPDDGSSSATSVALEESNPKMQPTTDCGEGEALPNR